MHERHNSIANALELCLSCTYPSIYVTQNDHIMCRVIVCHLSTCWMLWYCFIIFPMHQWLKDIAMSCSCQFFCQHPMFWFNIGTMFCHDGSVLIASWQQRMSTYVWCHLMRTPYTPNSKKEIIDFLWVTIHRKTWHVEMLWVISILKYHFWNLSSCYNMLQSKFFEPHLSEEVFCF